MSKKVYAVLTKYVDCPTYVLEEKIDSGVGLLDSLKSEAKEEGGSVQLIAKSTADKFMTQFEKRSKKEQAAENKKQKAAEKKAAKKKETLNE